MVIKIHENPFYTTGSAWDRFFLFGQLGKQCIDYMKTRHGTFYCSFGKGVID